MITWSLTLSGNQIAILKQFAPRVSGKEDHSYQHGVTNLIPGARALIREGLLEHVLEKYANGYMDMTRSGYFVTERGKFILSMIEKDIDKFLSVEGQAARKRGKKIAA